MLQKILKIASLLVASTILGVSAYAERVSHGSSEGNDMLLDTLVQKGYLTTAEAAGIADTTTPFMSQGAHTSKISIRGLMHVRHDLVSAHRHGQVDLADRNDIGLTIARIGVDAQLTPRWRGFMEFDFAGAGEATARAPKSASVSDLLNVAYIRWVAVEEELSFDFGYLCAPFGQEYNTSPAHTKTILYNPASFYFRDVLVSGNYSYRASRHTGLMAHGSILDDFYYKVAVTRPQANKVNTTHAGNNNTAALWGQFGWNTKWQEVDINIGMNGAFLPEMPADSAGCCGSTTYDIHSDELGKKFYLWGLYADLKYNEFSLFAEVMGGILEDQKGAWVSASTRRPDSNPIGFTIMPSYKWNDEFEFVFAYSYVDADDGVYFDVGKLIPGASSAGVRDKKEKMNSIYLGANWFILGNDVKLSFGYQYAKAESPMPELNANNGSENSVTYTDQTSHDNIHAFRTRLQLVF